MTSQAAIVYPVLLCRWCCRSGETCKETVTDSERGTTTGAHARRSKLTVRPDSCQVCTGPHSKRLRWTEVDRWKQAIDVFVKYEADRKRLIEEGSSQTGPCRQTNRAGLGCSDSLFPRHPLSYSFALLISLRTGDPMSQRAITTGLGQELERLVATADSLSPTARLTWSLKPSNQTQSCHSQDALLSVVCAGLSGRFECGSLPRIPELCTWH